MFREYLLNSNEEVVVCTDANDVLANPGSPKQVMELLSDELVVGGDTSCWTGEPCDQATLDVVTRIHEAHFDKVMKLEGGRMGYGAPSPSRTAACTPAREKQYYHIWTGRWQPWTTTSVLVFYRRH